MLAAWQRVLVLASAALSGIGCTNGPISPPAQTPAVAVFGDSLFGKDAARWFVVDALGGSTARPAVDQTLVYFGRGEFTLKNEIAARDRTTGELRWHQQFPIARNVVLAGDVVAGAMGLLDLFDRQTGTVSRAYAPPNDDAIESNTATDGTRFYVGTYYGQVISLDASANEVWRRPLTTNSSTVAFGIAVAGDRVAATLKYFPLTALLPDSGIVAVLDRSTGSVIWRVGIPIGALDAAIVDAPVILGNLVIVVTQSHQLHAYELSSGHEVWSYDASRGHPEVGSYGIAGCDGAIIVSDGNMGLVSLNATTGVVNWQLPDLRIGGLSSIDCSYGTVLALSTGILKVFDASHGTLLRRVPASEQSRIFVATAGSDASTLYVASDRGFGAVALR